MTAKKKEVRLGRQTPTVSVVLPYTKTRGGEAIELYEKSGRTAQDWQKLLMYDILATNDDDLWVHTRFGYSVPRRNGKNEILAIREMFGLLNGEHILHTAHRTTTTHSAWERLGDLLAKAKVEITSSYRAYGKEHIAVEGGGKVEFRTRTSKGGLGEGFDLLIIDEAQEYTIDQESALKYVVSDSHNPQTLFCGTPPTPQSSGTVFTEMRKTTIGGDTKNTGWAEWSVENQRDPNDVEAWYETNPSLGTVLTERKIADEVGSDVIDFNIQRLGLWISYNQKSAISENDWNSLKADVFPKVRGKLFVGIKYGMDGANVAMSVAVKTYTDKIFVETIDCRSTRTGDKWILDFLKKAYIQEVVVEGSRRDLLTNEMADLKIKAPILLKYSEAATCYAAFEQGIFDKRITHRGQDSLANVVTNVEKRSIGTNGGFGYKSILPGLEIALLDSVALAYWRCLISKEPKKQKIWY